MDCAIDYAGNRIAFGKALIKLTAVQVCLILIMYLGIEEFDINCFCENLKF